MQLCVDGSGYLSLNYPERKSHCTDYVFMGEILPQQKLVTKLQPISRIQLLVFQFPLTLWVQYLMVFPNFIINKKLFPS